MRINTVGPDGIRVVNGPLPKGRNVFVAREDIRSSSIRTQYATFESKPGGTVRIKHYLVGVETKTGHIDIAYPYLRLDDAKVVAQKIATAIGGAEVTATTNLPAGWGKSQKSWRLKVLLWGDCSYSQFSREHFGKSVLCTLRCVDVFTARSASERRIDQGGATHFTQALGLPHRASCSR